MPNANQRSRGRRARSQGGNARTARSRTPARLTFAPGGPCRGLDRHPGPATLRPDRRALMAPDLTLHVADMVAAAEREIETLPVAEAMRRHRSGDVSVVDLV